MQLYRQLGLNIKKKEVISFVGGGGKTTSIKSLAKELSDIGMKVLITTTTKIFEPMEDEGEYFFIENIPRNFKPDKGTITIFGENIRDGKLIGATIDKIDNINNRGLFDYILIEADGAKRKPIKAPDLHEPLIGPSTTITIGVMGIDAIGLEIVEDMVHRPEILKHLLNVGENHIINSNDIVNLSLHPKGLFKSSKGKKILFLNKVRTDIDISNSKEIQQKLIDSNIQIVMGDIINKMYY